jgi:hypothetical protein
MKCALPLCSPRTSNPLVRKWGDHDIPVHIAPGEKLGLECQWDNSPENQPEYHGHSSAPKDTNWGEGSNDEMCVAMLSVTES